MGIFSIIPAETKTSENVLSSGVIAEYLVLEEIGASNDSGIAQGIFFNNSDKMLESFYVEVFTEKGQYYFETTILPPYSYVILEDREKRVWSQSSIVQVCGNVKISDAREDDVIAAISVSQGELIIHHSKAIESADIFLKVWDDQRKMYAKDKTYKVALKTVYAGDEICVKLPGQGYEVVSVFYNGIHIINRRSHNESGG